MKKLLVLLATGLIGSQVLAVDYFKRTIKLSHRPAVTTKMLQLENDFNQKMNNYKKMMAKLSLEQKALNIAEMAAIAQRLSTLAATHLSQETDKEILDYLDTTLKTAEKNVTEALKEVKRRRTIGAEREARRAESEKEAEKSIEDIRTLFGGPEETAQARNVREERAKQKAGAEAAEEKALEGIAPLFKQAEAEAAQEEALEGVAPLFERAEAEAGQ